jgi:hypothetical protein
MLQFEERERAFEKEFERNQELAFKLAARRNKLFGLWAAGRMGRRGNAATAYALDIVDAGATGDDDAIVARVLGDLIASGFPIDAKQLQSRLQACAGQARTQLSGTPGSAGM